jgi:predicted Zn-dependent protease
MSEIPEERQSRAVPSSAPALIEIGWVIVGKLEDPDRHAVLQARERLQDYLEQTFPEFTWRMPVVQREELAHRNREELVVLLEYGVTEREARHWDFAIIVTDADLAGHYKSYALGAPARSVSVAALSTARLDPRATRIEATTDERLETMSRRIEALAAHLFGHLNGLPHHEDTSAFMYDLETVDALDRMTSFPQPQIERLRANLHEVADLRLEEEPAARTQPLWFYVRGIWIGRDDIINAILHARPWEFPLRLSRFTTAALSAMLILLVTAEVWDVGMHQSPGVVIALSVFALAFTSTYVLKRQRLLAYRRVNVLSEQTVITKVSIVAVVLLGMLTTYAVLFLSVLACSLLVFHRQVIRGWTMSLEGKIHTADYLVMSAFVASLGLLIGALGASFEQHHYFRHITYIDEET